MLRRVFVIGLMTACHPAPAPTVVHAPPTVAATPTTDNAPVRQDFELVVDTATGPLREVLATGHECGQEPPSPINDAPLTGRRLIITATPEACQRHRDGRPLLH